MILNPGREKQLDSCPSSIEAGNRHTVCVTVSELDPLIDVLHPVTAGLSLALHHFLNDLRTHADSIVDNLQLNTITDPPACQTDGNGLAKPGMLEYILHKRLQQQQ